MKTLVLNKKSSATDNNNNNGSPKTISTLNTTKVSTMNTSMVRRWWSSFLLLGIVFSALVVNANADVWKNPCDKGNPVCTTWTKWSDVQYEYVLFPSKEHGSCCTFNCPIQVLYRYRECTKDRFVHEYEIVGYRVDLSYEIYLYPEGWVRPCVEALDILKGNSTDVSLKNNELVRNLFKQLTLQSFTAIAEQHPGFSPCDPDPNDPNRPHVDITTNVASCQGSCITWGSFWWDIFKPEIEEGTENGKAIPTDSLPPLELLAEIYDAPLTGENAIKIRPISEEGAKEVNEYIQTKINPYIPEAELKIPQLPGQYLNWYTRYKKCAADFCCVYRVEKCQDKDGKIHVTEEYLGDVITPTECRDTDPVTVRDCILGRFYQIYPCTLNGCNE